MTCFVPPSPRSPGPALLRFEGLHGIEARVGPRYFARAVILHEPIYLKDVRARFSVPDPRTMDFYAIARFDIRGIAFERPGFRIAGFELGPICGGHHAARQDVMAVNHRDGNDDACDAGSDAGDASGNLAFRCADL